MGVSTWHYLVCDNDTVQRVSQRIVTQMRENGAGMPELASSKRRIIAVDVASEGRKPRRIIQAIGRYWTFDDRGRIGAGLRREHADRVDLFPGALGRGPKGCIDARQEFKFREAQHKHHWRPTDDLMAHVIKDIWPTR